MLMISKNVPNFISVHEKKVRGFQKLFTNYKNILRIPKCSLFKKYSQISEQNHEFV